MATRRTSSSRSGGHRIVVLGGGYSGVMAAKLAARLPGAEVTLVNVRDRFVERVRMHQFATGQRLRERPLADLLRDTGVRLRIDRVEAIDPARRQVRLRGGMVDYDLLIYALGSQAELESVPGVAEHAYTVASVDEAARLGRRLADARVVAVVGAGLTGLETSTELAERHPELTVKLLTGAALGERLSQRGRRHLRDTLDRLGVQVIEQAQVTKVGADGVLLSTGEEVGADTVVWTTGFAVSDLAYRAGFAVDAHRRIIVDETMRSVSHPEVYAVGDAAVGHAGDGVELRMACATAMPAAQHAVRAIADRMAGRQPRPLRFRYLNQCISLGRHNGLIQFVRPDDTPVEAVLTGRLAALYKEVIVRGTITALNHPGLPTAV